MFTAKIKLSLAVLISSFVLLSPEIFPQSSVNEHSIKFSGLTTATLVGEDGVIMKTTNNGLNWDEQPSGITNVLYGNSQVSGLSLTVGENGVILRSTDGGQNWNPISKGSNTLEHLRDVELIDNLIAVVCGDNGTLLRTSDAGLTWLVITSGVTSNLNDVKFVPGGVGFVTGDNSVVIKTTDNGENWAEIDMSFTNGKINAIEAIDENNLVLVGEAGKVLLSNDGGNSWFAPMSLLYESDFNDVLFFDALNGVIVGNDGLIIRTNDGGFSWNASETVFSGDNYDFYSVSFADQDNGITIGKNGIDIYTTDGGITWLETAPDNNIGIALVSDVNMKRTTLNQNYPNPFNPSTKISYEIPYDATVSIKIYDMIGKEVASLVSGNQTAGLHTVDFNASNLSSGVYFYTLNVENGREKTNKVMRMILTK